MDPAAAVDRFIIRKEHEWAFVYVDEKTGVFACYSSFGTYAYCWTHIGDRTLKQFLSGLNFDYFMGKTRRDYLRFDFDATVEGIKQHIKEGRRNGDLTKAEARAAWGSIEDLSDENSPDRFADSLYWSKPLMHAYGNDMCDVCRERPDPDSRGFWKTIWPEFLKNISATAEIAA
jgi:hypothetical protein